MNHFYQNIQGWFTHPDFYRDVADFLPHINFQVAEVGVWKGQSFAFLGVELINRNKTGVMHAVDSFAGSEEHRPGGLAFDPVTVDRGALEKEFRRNINPLRHDVLLRIDIHSMGSPQATSEFHDGQLDVCFIDAAHDYLSVTTDVTAWWPKVRSGGWLCGHDFSAQFPGVQRAVRNFAEQERVMLMPAGDCWLIGKP